MVEGKVKECLVVVEVVKILVVVQKEGQVKAKEVVKEKVVAENKGA